MYLIIAAAAEDILAQTVVTKSPIMETTETMVSLLDTSMLQ